MTDRLFAATLPRLPQSVTTPTYDRQSVTPGIVHLGVGAFHRAHQAVFIDDCLNRGETRWGIVAASLRSPDTRDAIEPQDNLYTFACETVRASACASSVRFSKPSSPRKSLNGWWSGWPIRASSSLP